MRAESEVWQALLRRKGLSVTDLAAQLGVTRQHAHRLLAGHRPADSQREELEHALALGTPTAGNPLFAVGELDDNGELTSFPRATPSRSSQAGRWLQMSPTRSSLPPFMFACFQSGLRTGGGTWLRSMLPGARTRTAQGLRCGQRRRGPALGRACRGGSGGPRRDAESTRQGTRSGFAERGRVETSTAKLALCFPQ